MEKEELALKDIYYDTRHPASLGGVEKLYSAVKERVPGITRQRVKEWLRGQETYTLHRKVKLKHRRRRVTVGHEGQQLQADLLDVRNHSRDNDGINYLLTAVDCFSRRGWAIPVKYKTGEKVAEALQKIIEGSEYFALQTDKGKEFYNDKVSSLLKRNNVKHFSVENDDIKASLVERFNQTLRGRIHRSITARQNKRFLHILPDIVAAYNDADHRALGMAPNDVGPRNRERLHQKMYVSTTPPIKSKTAPPLKEGDVVRLSKRRGAFERGYTPNWTRELFRVTKVSDDVFPTVYRVSDLANETVRGTFYRQELQLVKEPEDYKVETVLRTRKKTDGTRQYFVRWLGYPDSFNSWVDEKDFTPDA